MPLPIKFDWSEDEHLLFFVLHVRGIKAKAIQGNVSLCDVYVKVNCHPSMFEVDLLHEIDPEHAQTRCRVGADKISLSLKKKEPGLWHEFRAKGDKAELRERRKLALAALAERETQRLQKRDEWRQDRLHHAETEQWRLDRENREQVEKWEAEEKAKWENDVYAAFDEDGSLKGPEERQGLADGDLDAPDSPTAAAAPAPRQRPRREPRMSDSERAAAELLREEDGAEEVQPVVIEEVSPTAAATQSSSKSIVTAGSVAKDDSIWKNKDLDDTEEYIPDVRENPGKIGLRFTARPRAGIPVRDRGQRAPPFPKQQVKSELPPMLEGDVQQDEHDPVWLKDKADSLMVNGDYQGACNAYTEALKIALNARAFANRGVANLYLGNLEQCLEDCTSAIRILDKRAKVPDGQMGHTVDPQDQVVRVRVDVRMGTAYLWLGAFSKAEAHYQKALDAEDGLQPEERKVIEEDIERIRAAKAALVLKEKADGASDRAQSSASGETLEQALQLYAEAAQVDAESAVVHANRSFAHLRAGEHENALEETAAALDTLRRWPAAQRAPKKPEAPARLDPPFLDDPTFKHPDEQKHEVDWLMKHGGGSAKDLPSLPAEYEWVKDAAEKDENSWIAIRKKMSKATIDAIRRATTKLQDVLYTRVPRVIREHLEIAIEENKAGEGPSNTAIRQSQEFADKLEEYLKECEAEREMEEAELKNEFENFDLDDRLSVVRSGVGQTGFGPGHSVERTRRRLFVKVLLRRARALEALERTEDSIAELRRVLLVEPENREARQRLKDLEAPAAAPAPAPEAATASGPPAPNGHRASTSTQAAFCPPAPVPSATAEPNAGQTKGPKAKPKAGDAAVDLEDEGDDEVDHASTNQLLAAAAEYMRKNDYEGALQIYGYARNRCKVWESAATELKVLSNRSLCLQRVRGRLPELITACNEALQRIEELQQKGDFGGLSEELLLRMQCACLSRRGNAYMQQRKNEEGSRDLGTVRQLLVRVGELEASGRPAPAG